MGTGWVLVLKIRRALLAGWLAPWRGWHMLVGGTLMTLTEQTGADEGECAVGWCGTGWMVVRDGGTAWWKEETPARGPGSGGLGLLSQRARP